MLTHLNCRDCPNSILWFPLSYHQILCPLYRHLIDLFIPVAIFEHPINLRYELFPILVMQCLETLIILRGIFRQVFIQRHPGDVRFFGSCHWYIIVVIRVNTITFLFESFLFCIQKLFKWVSPVENSWVNWCFFEENRWKSLSWSTASRSWFTHSAASNHFLWVLVLLISLKPN